MPYTWPKTQRITKSADYSTCYSIGQRYFTKHFVIFVLKKDSLMPHDSGRVGLTVSKKIGNAVQRNRIKRVLREFFRLHQTSVPHVDIVVTPKRHVSADQIKLSVVEEDFLPFLAKITNKLST